MVYSSPTSTERVEDPDYIIVGSGSAACPLARKLVDSGATVAVFEAGDRNDLPEVREVSNVSALYSLYDSDKAWNVLSTPQKQLGGRRLDCVSGRLVGGSSSLNGMVYCIGNSRDYASWWEVTKDERWSPKNVFDAFQRLGVTSCTEYTKGEPLFEEMIAAANKSGISPVADYNNYWGEQKGAGFTQINADGPLRQDAFTLFLKDVVKQRDPALFLYTNSTVTKVLIDDDNNAYGVEYTNNGEGRVQRLSCKKEVIVSAGAIGSPKLLLLSGIGDRAHLEPLGIDVKSHVPAVGKNMSGSAVVGVFAEQREKLTKPLIYNMGVVMFHSFDDSEKLLVPGQNEQKEKQQQPEVEIQQYVIDRWGPYSNMYGLGVIVLHPKSKGSVGLASSEPADDPLIDYNYLLDPDDLELLVKGTQKAYEIMSNYEPAGTVVFPSDCSKPTIVKHIKSTGSTDYHPAGTCRMADGFNDRNNVVDAKLRVKNVRNLRVCDASIFPSMPSGNTNAAAMMVGSIGADIILE